MRRAQIERVDLLQLRDPAHGLGAEGRLSLEGVQHDPLEEVPQRHVVVFGERLQHLHEALFHAHAGLDSFDSYHGTKIPG
jgi:hypothetical protein